MAIGKRERQNNLMLVKAMHVVVMGMNDEDAIEPWFYSYPDEADEEELLEIAGDAEMMDDLCSNFRRRMEQGARDGWFTQHLDEFGESFGKQEKSHVYGAKEEA